MCPCAPDGCDWDGLVFYLDKLVLSGDITVRTGDARGLELSEDAVGSLVCRCL